MGLDKTLNNKRLFIIATIGCIIIISIIKFYTKKTESFAEIEEELPSILLNTQPKKQISGTQESLPEKSSTRTNEASHQKNSSQPNQHTLQVHTQSIQTKESTPQHSVLQKFSAKHGGFTLQLPLGYDTSPRADEDGDWDGFVATNPQSGVSYFVAGTKYDISDEDEARVATEIFGVNPESFDEVPATTMDLSPESGMKAVYCFESQSHSRTVSGCHLQSLVTGRHFIVAVDGNPIQVRAKEKETDLIYDTIRNK